MKKNKIFEVTSCPHIFAKSESIKNEMFDVILALIPAFIVSILLFGINAVKITLLSIIFCVIIEYFFNKLFFKKNTITDFSAVVTGILLAFNMPSNVPWWILFIGAFIAIVIGKIIFGGIGQNPFNPALLARVVLLISWPAIMTTWPKPQFINSIDKFFKTDITTAATPLGILAEKGTAVLTETGNSNLYLDLFFGNIGGCIGETSALALILGGLFLIFRKRVTWHIPICFILSVFIFSGIFWLIDDVKYADPLFHILSGGVMLGAFFMATDYVTSPLTKKGMLIFGIGCGFITVIIRLFGAYPEGVSFSILFMNAFVPIIDNYTKPKRYGLQNLRGN